MGCSACYYECCLTWDLNEMLKVVCGIYKIYEFL